MEVGCDADVLLLEGWFSRMLVLIMVWAGLPAACLGGKQLLATRPGVDIPKSSRQTQTLSPEKTGGIQ